MPRRAVGARERRPRDSRARQAGRGRRSPEKEELRLAGVPGGAGSSCTARLAYSITARQTVPARDLAAEGRRRGRRLALLRLELVTRSRWSTTTCRGSTTTRNGKSSRSTWSGSRRGRRAPQGTPCSRRRSRCTSSVRAGLYGGDTRDDRRPAVRHHRHRARRGDAPRAEDQLPHGCGRTRRGLPAPKKRHASGARSATSSTSCSRSSTTCLAGFVRARPSSTRRLADEAADGARSTTPRCCGEHLLTIHSL